jgi:hypothetical protein
MHRALLPCALVAAACGGNDEILPDARRLPDGPDVRTAKVAAVAGDFNATGVLSTVEAPSLAVAVGAVAGVAGADPRVRRIGDELFVINRFGGDNVTILDALTLDLVRQIGTGGGSNPQDVAVVDDKLYVAALAASGLLVIDRTTPGQIDVIDLSSLDDDGVPDCVSVHAVGARVFAVCGLLDNFVADGPGVVAVIDAATDRVVDTFELPFANPQGWLERAPGGAGFGDDLLIGTVPSYTDYAQGCLVRISTGADPGATCGPDNRTLGGFIGRLGVSDSGEVWAAVSAYDAIFTASGKLVRFAADTGQPGAALSPPSRVIQDVAACGPYVFVADGADGAKGIRVYDTDGAEQTSSALDAGLPPAFGGGLACMAVAR